jgi:nicotinamide riboside kinase
VARVEEKHESGLVICLTGPESTGKTTLAAALAAEFDLPLVPEAARDYLRGRTAYNREDLLAIAELQLAAEARALASGSPAVLADTDLMVIQVWWEEKFGELDVRISEGLQARSARRYLLTQPDIPWAPDPLRESPNDRPRLYLRYQELLVRSEFPFAEIGGEGGARLKAARLHVSQWLEEIG